MNFHPAFVPLFIHHPTPPLTSTSTHLHLDGDSLTLHSPSLTSIATGSLQNKIFPPKKEIWKLLQKAFLNWHQRNALPSIPTRILEELWTASWTQHTQQLQNHITHRDITRFTQLFPGAVFHNAQLPCASTARASTLSACRTRSPTLRSSSVWRSPRSH